jgi:hypothetical protein
MQDEIEDSPGPREPGWRDRLWAIGAAAGRLIDTRAEILQEELSRKSGILGGGLAAIFVALLFGTLAGLLLTALLAALLSRLLGGPILGILATLVLYLAVAGAAAWFGVRRLSQVRPFEFPATRREIDRDLEAVRRALGVGQDGGQAAPPRSAAPPGSPEGSAESAAEIEARLRESAG